VDGTTWPPQQPRPNHLPLCSSFSTPSLRSIPQSPPSYGRANNVSSSTTPPTVRVTSPTEKVTGVQHRGGFRECAGDKSINNKLSGNTPSPPQKPQGLTETNRITSNISPEQQKQIINGLNENNINKNQKINNSSISKNHFNHVISNNKTNNGVPLIQVFNHNIGNNRRLRPSIAPPDKPQRTGAIARLAAKVNNVSAVTCQRSNSPLQQSELDENRVSIDLFLFFSLILELIGI
jgi:hypothetical protein